MCMQLDIEAKLNELCGSHISLERTTGMSISHADWNIFRLKQSR